MKKASNKSRTEGIARPSFVNGRDIDDRRVVFFFGGDDIGAMTTGSNGKEAGTIGAKARDDKGEIFTLGESMGFNIVEKKKIEVG